MGCNRYFQEEDGLSLDVGPFVTAIEFATHTQAMVLDKPASEFFLRASANLGCPPNEVVMVGDDVFTDAEGALISGFQVIPVQTGKIPGGR